MLLNLQGDEKLIFNLFTPDILIVLKIVFV
jgi:hypothetical protein